MVSKEFANIEKPLGTDGKFEAAVGIEGSDLVAKVEVKYPVLKIAEPALKVVDDLVDRLEKLIPGDQTAMAQAAKADARAALLKLVTEQAKIQG